MTIFNDSQAGRYASAQAPQQSFDANLPTSHQRTTHLGLPEVSELQAVRHFTRLAKKNYSIDTHFYPLGSCTMKYNPRGVQKGANHPDFLNLHPLADATSKQGLLHCLYELQEYIKAFTGMHTVALTRMAGSQGEFVGVAMIRAYHLTRGDHERTEIIVPDAAHGTNPASAAMCGFKVREIPTVDDGDIDVDQLRAMVGPQTAGIMLTNPSTLGVFSRRIGEIAGIVHQAGGLLYYDGANLNAILGKVRPGDMGFDVIHLNLHKTFATPHGGGGPGAGPVAVSERLAPFLPTPLIAKQGEQYVEVIQENHPQSIGRITTFMGNAGILLRAYAYIRLLGKKGLHNVAEYATLNANYLMARLEQAGFTLAYPKRRASHEFIITLAPEKKAFGITALDFAKRLLDYGFHAPTVYFPLCVPECLLIEPTETECKEELDSFINAMIAIRKEAQTEPEKLRGAPYTTPVGRLDEVKAARQLDLVWQEN